MTVTIHDESGYQGWTFMAGGKQCFQLFRNGTRSRERLQQLAREHVAELGLPVAEIHYR